ncbi:hypothetical protein V1264_024238 [Littorina saxatilis]|uniref:ATP-dependent DNA helicase n=2 Tax=Littorina saxatilis TaxID=31220 RepID=A0AAN9FZM9_9CAEN
MRHTVVSNMPRSPLPTLANCILTPPHLQQPQTRMDSQNADKIIGITRNAEAGIQRDNHYDDMFTGITRNNAAARSQQMRHTVAGNMPHPPRQIPFLARLFPPKVNPFSLGKMNQMCSFCQAFHFLKENHNCCHKGKVQLPPLATYPQEIEQLLTRNTPQSLNFREHIRQYNSSLAFASFGANIALPPGKGPYAFRLHGQVYHRSGCLHPSDVDTAAYSQLYIMEGNQAVDARLQNSHNEHCRRDTMMLLTNLINRTNPYAAAYKQMQQVEVEEEARALADNRTPSSVTMHILRGPDQKRYNNPQQDELAVIFSSHDGAPPQERDIVVYPRNELPKSISYMSANIDPMVYPLFFPHGELGWQCHMQHVPAYSTNKRTRLTTLQFYAHRLSVRQAFSPLFYGSKLFQQYIVDAYIRVETGRMNFIRNQQNHLRVEMYQGLMDHIHSQAHENNLNPGKLVILPSSFQGSPRAMQQNYQDAMAIVSKYGKPDLFLTYTCNPRCKDICDALLPGQQAHDRPDIVARVFKLHLAELINDITKRHVLGKPVAYVYVIEFQKRGLPHCHLLIILDENSKLKIAADIDTLISAEIPDPHEDPVLFEIVKSTMIHGPCGALDPNSPCMVDGNCSKDYPKQFRNETALAIDGYPHYRRSDNGRTVVKGRNEVDNRWVVPYNPYLTKKYNAHINLEACTTVKSVKYLFKYVYKGHDSASVEVREANVLNHDEVSTFMDCRYISAPESYWRLAENKLHLQSHTIIRLALHLPQNQPVFFTPGRHEAAAEASASRHTTLTAFFETNAKTPTTYTYNEFPNHFVFHKNSHEWKPRKKGGHTVIGRVYSASPKDIERFCLRVLLHHVRGPTSYEDLKTVEGYTASTFKEACILRHLLSDDVQWDKTMEEAAVFQMPIQLRVLFANLCTHCSVTNPLDMWEKHKDAMMEDFSHQGIPAETSIQLALNHIDSILQQNGLSASILGLPKVHPITICNQETEFDIATETRQAFILTAKLNEEQSLLISSVLQDLAEVNEGKYTSSCRTYFLDGPGGSGKTMVYNTLISTCRSQHIKVAASAWTGIAATLLSGGRTVHNLFKLPVPILDTSTCNVSPTSSHAEYLRSVKLFIIDEASMVPANALKAIDNMLQDITKLKVPFGGKVFLMGGDFRQVLPVVPRASPTVIIENCIKSSPLWPLFRVFKLTKNMRAEQDQQEYAKWLLQLGNGQLQSVLPTAPPNSIDIPPQCNITEDIVNAVFTDVTNPQTLAATVILATTNDTTLHLNDLIVNKLPGQSKTYISADQAICDVEMEADNYPTEFLNSITPPGMPPHQLILKTRAIIMLLRVSAMAHVRTFIVSMSMF